MNNMKQIFVYGKNDSGNQNKQSSILFRGRVHQEDENDNWINDENECDIYRRLHDFIYKISDCDLEKLKKTFEYQSFDFSMIPNVDIYLKEALEKDTFNDQTEILKLYIDFDLPIDFEELKQTVAYSPLLSDCLKTYNERSGDRKTSEIFFFVIEKYRNQVMPALKKVINRAFNKINWDKCKTELSFTLSKGIFQVKTIDCESHVSEETGIPELYGLSSILLINPVFDPLKKYIETLWNEQTVDTKKKKELVIYAGKKFDNKKNAVIFSTIVPVQSTNKQDDPQEISTDPYEDDLSIGFSFDDLNADTDCFRYTANNEGLITIEFFIENEHVYSEVLTRINNLMIKGYNRLFDGFSLSIRFKEDPVFLPVCKLPHVSVHAFFARAAIYPSLHEKIRQYISLVCRKYDWYLNIESTPIIPGTFAAIALLLHDIKHVDIFRFFTENCVEELQDIQLYGLSSIIDKFGITEKTIPVIFETMISSDQNYCPDNVSNMLENENSCQLLIKYLEDIQCTCHFFRYKLQSFSDKLLNEKDISSKLTTIRSLSEKVSEKHKNALMRFEDLLTREKFTKFIFADRS